MATQVWEFQAGTSEGEFLTAAAIGSNGTFVFGGNTRGNFSGSTAGEYDWVAFKVDAEGDIMWTWQNGTSKPDLVGGMAMTEDESVVLGGYRVDSDGCLAAKLDVDGNLLWQWEDGTAQEDIVRALALTADGSSILAGSTRGDWNTSNIGDSDFAASKLDVNGNLLWKWQNGTRAGDELSAVAVGKDGSVVLAGHSYGNWSGQNSGLFDFAAIKLDADMNELWRWQGGTAYHDKVLSVAIGNDGSVFWTGHTAGSWAADNAGDLGSLDFVACKLDDSGNEVWRWQDGTAVEDRFDAVFEGEDGSVILAGYTRGVWDSGSFGGADYTAVKLDESGVELWRWQNGSTGDDLGYAFASGSTISQLLLVGASSGAWASENANGAFDFAAVVLDTTAPPSAVPTPVPTFAGDTTTPLSLSPTPSFGTTQLTGQPSLTTPTPAIIPDTPSSRPTTSPSIVGEDRAPAQPLAPNPTPTIIPDMPSSRPTSPPIPTTGRKFWNTTMISVFLGVPLLTGVVVILGWRWLGRPRKRRDVAVEDVSQSIGPRRHVVPSTTRDTAQDTHFSASPDAQTKSDVNESIALASFDTIVNVSDAVEGNATSLQLSGESVDAIGESEVDGGHEGHPASVSHVSNRRAQQSTNQAEGDEYDVPEPGGSGNVSINGIREPVHGIGVVHAVIEAAEGLARVSPYPGVSTVVGSVIALMNMVAVRSDLLRVADNIVKRCRTLMFFIQRASSELQKVGDADDPFNRHLIEDVGGAVAALVEIIKTYQSKGKLSQVIESMLFKRRKREAEEAMDEAIQRLQFGFQVEMGRNSNEFIQDLRSGLLERPETGSATMLEARRARRQRNLEEVEIPEGDVRVTDELIGQGGFGKVYIADYNGRNAAAKVFDVKHEFGSFRSLEEEIPVGIGHTMTTRSGRDNRLRKSFWRELEAMRRLRSPHTVNVYGAITSRTDRYILIMELLPGGDLRALLNQAEEPLAEEHARRIVRDICAGMAFLHRKEMVHGDMKSANVLFDGDGRAKIGDFGTSKWPQLLDSTGLATYTTQGSQTSGMSVQWAAPEVLDMKVTSYGSDVYSFGVVVWEVFSRNIPWADETCRNDIFKRVVFKENRLEIPADSPSDMTRVMTAAWAVVPEDRPTFCDIMKWQGWE